jgi:RimJ/RimL family protein N-acetyltransferase
MLTKLINNKNIWNNVRDQLPYPYTLKDADVFLKHNVSSEVHTNFAILWNKELAGGIGYIPKEDVYKRTAEIGYWIGEPYWGKGIATQGIRQMVELIKVQSPNIVRIYAEVFDHNKGSMRVLEKNGFTREAIRKKSVIKNGIIMDDHVWVLILGE